MKNKALLKEFDKAMGITDTTPLKIDWSKKDSTTPQQYKERG